MSVSAIPNSNTTFTYEWYLERARRDDWHQKFVGSDIREILSAWKDTHDELKGLEEAVRRYLELTDLQGHLNYCDAVRGPAGENWVEPELCNCELKGLKAAFDDSKTS